MGKREDARFERGELGVDGEAVTEEKDVAEVERDKAREQFVRGRTWLGREFLTWLLWRSEEGESLAKHEDEGVTPLVVGRVLLRGVQGDVVELSAKGTLAPYSEQVRRALLVGLLVHQARVRFTSGERVWEATLDAEHLDIRAAKLPELLAEADDDRITERLDLAEKLSGMVDALVGAFFRVRMTPRWRKEVVPALKAWMEEGLKGKTLDRARRAVS